MRVPSRTTSRPSHIVCPACGLGELRPRGPELADCDSCGLSVEGAIFRTLEQIAALPDALGAHACECGHPGMRLLPDGVFHCPSCGSEVLPIEASSDLEKRGLNCLTAEGWRLVRALVHGDMRQEATRSRERVLAKIQTSRGCFEVKQWWTVVAVGVAVFVAGLDTSITNVALPTLARKFDVDPGGVAWVVLAYNLPREDRTPSLISRCESLIARATAYSREHLEDVPEIRDWTWTT